MNDSLTVAICTYNPDEAIFQLCLSKLAAAAATWQPAEILVIDNNSLRPVQDMDCLRQFVNAHPQTRVLSEPKQGLTPARLSAIRSARSEVIVFIDDDNLVRPDFLQKGMRVASERPYIGSWSGQVTLMFDQQPESWTRPYWGLLVHREFSESRWSNLPNLPETMPCGAGLFIRKTVGLYYLELHESGKRAIQLDRNGSSFFSAGDNDLAACACDIGLGVGIFPEIVLDHFIPGRRVSKDYLLRLAEGIAASAVVFRSFRQEKPAELTIKNRIANMLRLVLKRGTQREFFKAVLKGEAEGKKIYLNNRL